MGRAGPRGMVGPGRKRGLVEGLGLLARVEPQTAALQIEQPAHGVPARSAAAHACAEATFLESAAAHVLQRRDDLLLALRQAGADALS